MNIFLKSLVSLIKIIVICAVVYLTLLLFFAQNITQLGIDIFVLLFISLPTIFIIFFKKKFLAKYQKFNILWKIICVIYVISIILYVGLFILGTWHLGEKAKTQKAIDFINSRMITLDDVMGKNLPLEPDQKLNDSTIAGIDTNQNGIRDDVELAIFKKYPDSAKIRAAELQYAQALQLELTQVFNSGTLVTTIQKNDLAFDCLGYSGPDISLSAAKQKEKEMNDLLLNTDLRKKQYSNEFEKYMTGYASLPGPECNIDLSLLPN